MEGMRGVVSVEWNQLAGRTHLRKLCRIREDFEASLHELLSRHLVVAEVGEHRSIFGHLRCIAVQQQFEHAWNAIVTFNGCVLLYTFPNRGKFTIDHTIHQLDRFPTHKLVVAFGVLRWLDEASLRLLQFGYRFPWLRTSSVRWLVPGQTNFP